MKSIKCFIVLLVIFISLDSYSQKIPCEGGMAGEYPCANIDLIGHLTTDDLLAEEQGGFLLNDIWGWTDPDTGKEYAIVGMANGTSFVDISDPENPKMLGMLPEHHKALSHKNSGKPEHDNEKSLWRDIKVYKNHAFIVSEDNRHGMQIFDLTDLRSVTNAPEEFLEAGHYAGISNAHNIVINEETGFAYIVGATGSAICGQGGLHIINIQDPKIPEYVACFDNDGYTHDAQCVIYDGPDLDYSGKEICFNSNEDTITIVDVDDKDNIQIISRSSYETASYTHQGWLTEDHKYFLSNDELDETSDNHTRTYIWDVQDLDSPILIGIYTHNTNSTDHNLYISDGKVYESNYTSGLQVLEMSKISEGKLNTIAYFDTYPANNNYNFEGSWSNYPFFKSGVIVVSDITNGLFILKLKENILTEISEQPSNIQGCLNESYKLNVIAVGINLTYQWQINTGTEFVNISDSENIKGANTNVLLLENIDESFDGSQFKCIVTSDGSLEMQSDISEITILKETTADFEYSTNDKLVKFTNLSKNASEYLWRFGDLSNSTDEESPEHLYKREFQSEYPVTLVASNDCFSDEITKIVNVEITSTDLEADNFDLNIFPVPAKGTINLVDSKNLFEKYGIYNSSGQLVLSGSIDRTEFIINISLLEKGLYLMELEGKSGKSIRRFIIE